ncbi:MAG: tetratricopeptide (TPR) repeat protein [Neolewinella sp.]|jgi:tetratricopeptide (TPR) repeat protein
MSLEALIERINILQSQNRWAKSRSLLESYLAGQPDDPIARAYYINTLLNLGEKKLARDLIEPMVEEYPDNPMVLELAAHVELKDDKPKVAEQYAALLVEMNPEDDNAHLLMAKVKLNQRNYDVALQATDQALSLNPENQEALNFKIYLAGFLNTGQAGAAIEDALNLNPEDSSTIANHGYQLLREGKVDEALERIKYALSLDPTNQLGRFAMLEALKARFWPYRLYFKYQEIMSKLSGGASFGIMIGLWLGVQFLSRVGRNNPDLAVFTQPLVYFIVTLFLLTWIIDPIMNFYLLTNPYGRLLLDEDDKLMAKLVGGSLGLSILSIATWFGTGSEMFLMLAFAFLVLTIPLGSFLRPVRKNQRNLTTAFTIGLVAVSLTSIIFQLSGLTNIALLGLLGYQFFLNGIMAREGGRTFGE